MDNIFIILVNYNNAKLTIDCVNSIKNSTYKNCFMIIVDNASNDDSFELLSIKYENDEKVCVIESESNNGFSAGNNIGIKYAINHGADYVVLLNNDTVVDDKMIEELHKYANESTVTTPKMYYFANQETIWYAGGKIDYRTGNVKHFGLNERDSTKYSVQIVCSFATGCCIMIHKSIFEKIGFLDESYFMYGEDVDYSIKLRKAEINILFIPNAKLWHKVGGSSKSSKLNIYYDTRNKLFLMDQFNFPITAKLGYRIFILLLYIRGLIKNNNDKYFKKAFVDYKKGIRGKVELDS